MSRRYFGEQKIETAIEEGDFIVLTFDDSSIRLPKKLFEVSVSKDPLNPTQLWDRQMIPVVKDTLDTWLSWDVKLEQLDYLVNMIKTSIEHNLGKANDKLWGQKVADRRLSDVDNILKDGTAN